MSSSKSLDLFNLIKSLTKSEKRAFKLFAKRGGGSDLLFLKLFDLIDTMEVLDDDLVLKKLKLASKGKYSNLKRHLYTQILSSMRMLYADKMPNIKIRELIDKAYVLYGKGLYMQALNVLKNAKSLCYKYGTELSLLTIIEFEKNIHSRHITRLNNDEFEDLLESAQDVSSTLVQRAKLTNLKINLHKIYIERGHIRNKKEQVKVDDFFRSKIESIDFNSLKLMEKIYYCQCHVWYNYVINNYIECLKYAKKWVEIFKSSDDLKTRDYNLFLRGYHYLLTSAYNTKNIPEHQLYLDELEKYRNENYSKFDKNNKIVSFLYVHTSRLNNTFLTYDFEQALTFVPRTLRRLRMYSIQLDQHKIMVLHFKIAWTYIGAKLPEKSLKYLNGIIALKKKSLREDIQSYARLMHLMALYDLEDYEEILSNLRKYNYYFEQVKEKNDLQKATLKYFFKLCNSPIFDRKDIFKEFLVELENIKNTQFEKRAFLYLDIEYWVRRYC